MKDEGRIGDPSAHGLVRSRFVPRIGIYGTTLAVRASGSPREPRDTMAAIKRTGALLWETANEFMADDCPQMAGALSYYTVFSLPPLLVLLMLLVGAVVDPATVQELLTGQVGGLLGREGAAQVEALIQNASRPELSGAVAVLGVLAFSFGATGAFAQLQAALNRVWSVAPDPTRGDLRNFLLKRVVSFAMILSVGFLLLVSLALSALVSAFGALLGEMLPGEVSEALLQLINAGASFAVASLLFAAMFRYVPDAIVRWRDALVGGAFTSLLFTLGKTGIGYWLGRSDPGSAYGAAGSLAVVLLWIYYTAIILLLGAEFTQVWAARRGRPIVPEEGAARVLRSQERYVTGGDRPATAMVLLAAAAALLGAIPAAAQTVAVDAADPPLVESISFRGVSALSASDLRDAIATEARRCKSILYAPLCWISDSDRFEQRPRLDPDELARDELRIRVVYWRRGYRQATASAQLAPAGDDVDVIFDVREGAPTLLAAVNVHQTPPLLGAGALRQARLPARGAPLDVVELDSAKVRLRAMLWQDGYADALVRDSVTLSDNGLSATLDVTIQPNPRTTVGEVAVLGNQNVTTQTVERLVGLRPGQVFRRDDIADAQRRLYRSGLFRQALFNVPEPQDSSKRVFVTVREAPFNDVRTGVGFNTIEFVQAQARFTRYNWFGNGRRLDLHGALGNLLAPQLYGKSVFGSAVPRGITDEVEDVYLQPTWQLSVEVTQPWLLSARNALTVGIFAQRRSVPGIVVDRGYGASTTFTREVGRGVTTSLNYRYERTRVAAGDVYFCVNFGVCGAEIVQALRGTQSLSPLQASMLAVRTDDPLEPARGWTASFAAEHASAATASDFRYNQASADATRYLPLGPGVLAGRVHASWVRGTGGTAVALGADVAGRTLVHPRKRVYAGGSRSVRGYGENQLGPRVLTIDPQRLLAPGDSIRGEPCSPASLTDGSCDPNVAPSDEFLPRPLGGSSVIAATLEYRLRLTETFVAAVFVDGASVGDANLNVPPGPVRAITPGFGFRYRSPVGPVRVDLGIRPDITERLSVVTQIADENGELRLVQLATPKDYDPVESRGGFFRGVISRLQLHLSIGEAF